MTSFPETAKSGIKPLVLDLLVVSSAALVEHLYCTYWTMLLDSICGSMVSWLMLGSTTRSFFWSSSVCWVLPLRTSSFVFSRQEGATWVFLGRTMGMYKDYWLQQVYFQTSWFNILGAPLHEIIHKTILRKPFHNSSINHRIIQQHTSHGIPYRSL